VTVERAVRVVIGLGGVAIASYGVVLLAERGLGDLVDVGLWLAGGVLVHDALIAPVTLLVVAVAVRVVPGRWWAPAAAWLVVVGTVTLVAVPALGRFGAEPDNPTLLDRPYWTGWALFATLVAGAALCWGIRRRTPEWEGGDGRGPGARGR
jgi:hypothetical protein